MWAVDNDVVEMRMNVEEGNVQYLGEAAKWANFLEEAATMLCGLRHCVGLCMSVEGMRGGGEDRSLLAQKSRGGEERSCNWQRSCSIS